MGAVIDDLLNVAERENGGRTAYDRFDFQTAWGISKVIGLHQAGTNYAVGFEFHDDLVELDDADAPTTAVFYQMKSLDSGHWTLSRILDRPVAGKTKQTLKSSIAGKMFDNIKRFGAVVGKLVMVSNQPLSEVGARYEEVPLATLEQADVAKFVTAMKLECRGFKELDHLGYFHYEQCRLGLGSYEDAVFGQVGMLLHERNIDARPIPFTLHLVNEGRRRSKKLAQIKNFEELKRSKFMTRQQVDGWLTQLDNETSYRPSWESASRHLHLDHSREAALSREWHSYMAEKKRRWSAATLEMASEVKTKVAPIVDGAGELLDGINAAVPLVAAQIRKWKPGASDDFVFAVALYEYMR
ncbi:dsDNA nuclease domain-containing protein [Rhizobium leguminosarum]